MLINNSKKIVIKLGSTTVVDSKGKFKKKWVTSLIKDIKKLGSGKDFVIVSSGAIALGQKYLKIQKEMVSAMKAVHFNSTTIEALMEALYELNKKLLLKLDKSLGHLSMILSVLK